jgi:biotin carboxylase
MKTLLVLCPTDREYRDIPAVARRCGYNIIWDDFGGDYFDNFLTSERKDTGEHLNILQLIDQTIEKYQGKIDGVTSAVGYPGMSATAIIAKRMGLPGPAPEPIMICEHKFYAREAQRKFVPDATPEFYLIDPDSSKTVETIPDSHFPLFLKPVKSCFSMNAQKVESKEELRGLAKTSLLPEGFIKPFNDMWIAYADYKLSASYLLVESLLHGNQVSLEGYVENGKVVVMGIIDAIMFPGTISFSRFQYPSLLPRNVQAKMVETAEKLMSGMGYDNAMFNIELIHVPETDDVFIIEVNPKIASQFPDLFEKVDGVSSYAPMLQLAAGDPVTFPRGEGPFDFSASCVLRTFEDADVRSVPSQDALKKVQEKYPDARIQIYAKKGKRLSDMMQDVSSYRYGLVNIGAKSVEDLDRKFEDCKNSLPFDFVPAEK